LYIGGVSGQYFRAAFVDGGGGGGQGRVLFPPVVPGKALLGFFQRYKKTL
jgi:hypothetical protein